MLPDHPFPGDAVTANSRIKITKHDEFVSVGNSGDDGVQVIVKLVLVLIWVSHGRGIGADNGDELPSTTEGESHRHKAIIHTLWGTSIFADQCRFYCKANFSLSSLFRFASTPKERTSCTSFT